MLCLFNLLFCLRCAWRLPGQSHLIYLRFVIQSLIVHHHRESLLLLHSLLLLASSRVFPSILALVAPIWLYLLLKLLPLLVPVRLRRTLTNFLYLTYLLFVVVAFVLPVNYPAHLANPAIWKQTTYPLFPEPLSLLLIATNFEVIWSSFHSVS